MFLLTGKIYMQIYLWRNKTIYDS